MRISAVLLGSALASVLATAAHDAKAIPACPVSLPLSAAEVPAAGGSNSFAITIDASCMYTAVTSAGWISGLSVSGSTVSYTTADDGTLARIGTITVSNLAKTSAGMFTVSQDGLLISPAVTLQPVDTSVYVGDPLTLTVGASGGALAYQWKKDDGGDGGTFVALSGASATSATFAVAAATLGDSGDYDVVVSNLVGTVTSQVVHVTVSERPPVDAGDDGGDGDGADASLGGGDDDGDGSASGDDSGAGASFDAGPVTCDLLDAGTDAGSAAGSLGSGPSGVHVVQGEAGASASADDALSVAGGGCSQGPAGPLPFDVPLFGAAALAASWAVRRRRQRRRT